jgi:tripartite-type tricarboxylate transporter receptor subunit TctC
VIFDSMPSIIPHIRSGALRALAVTTATRSSQLPDTPAIAETVPGYEASALFGMGAPKDRLNREINAVLAEPAMQKQIVELGGDALIGTPEAFGTMIVAETDKWKRVIEGAYIQKVE